MEEYEMKRKYQRGRRLMLAAAALYALTQLLGYRPTPEPWNLPRYWDTLSVFIPAWVWMLAWFAVIVLCAVDFIRGKGRHGISSLVCMILAKAANFLASYIWTVTQEGWGSREWHTFGTALFTALIIVGLLMKVGALKPREGHE